MRRLGGWLLERWTALDLTLRDLQFYGGLVLFAIAPGRWDAVGAVLALHAWLAPVLARLLAGKA